VSSKNVTIDQIAIVEQRKPKILFKFFRELLTRTKDANNKLVTTTIISRLVESISSLIISRLSSL
jgi:hypothetical protein